MTAQVPGTGAEDSGGEASPPQPVYDGVEAWVTGQFLPMFRRPLGGEYRWCRQWWLHAEAITRLTALWHSWEALRLEPGTGMAIWLRDHLDHQLTVVLGRAGPLRSAARTSTSNPGKQRPSTHRPDGGTSATAGDRAGGTTAKVLQNRGPALRARIASAWARLATARWCTAGQDLDDR